ncbi:MAG TPA: undecaprenyl-diphosphate phosphatase [Acidimicrobiales bacterium]|nr:undecaprenyl-diphosphate phosphatase [Acidimicrobiales bacterium]
MTFLQAIVIGIIQGVAELFPISSLGHTVIIPAFIGGSWSRLVTQQASSESPYLAFVVGLHVATALALLTYFWRDWVRIIKGFFSSLAKRRAETADERAAWFVIVATIPVGILGLSLEHQLRTLFAKPLAAATFLTINGLILLGGEWLRRKGRANPKVRPSAAAERPVGGGGALASEPGAPVGTDAHDPEVLGSLRLRDALVVGVAQSAALLAGISRDGICMVTGLVRGLSYEDAARFAFLLSAPPILLAGLLKIPDLLGSLGNGIRGQVLAGSAAAFVMALLSVRFLLRYFQTRGLTPFACYCLALGAAGIVYFGIQ